MDASLRRLEEAVEDASSRLRGLREENAGLRARLGELESELESLRAETEEKARLVGELEGERSRFRSRLARLLDKLAGLQEPADESTLQV